MYPNQQMQLPYSPDQLQRHYLQGIDVNNPPFVPNLQSNAPMIAQYASAIAGAAAAEIQATAESNHLRRFFFNMFSQNNFQNEDFMSLVQAAADFLELEMLKNPGLQLAQILVPSVQKVVEMCVSHMTRVFPPLQQYLNPNAMYAVSQQLAHYDQIKQETLRLRQMQMGQQQQPMAYGAGYGMQQPAGAMGMRADPRLAPGGILSLGNNVTGNPSGLFGGPAVTPVISAHGRSMSDRFASYEFPNLSGPSSKAVTVNGNDEPAATPGNVSVVAKASAAPRDYKYTKEVSPVNPATPIEQPLGPLEAYGFTTIKWKRSDQMPYFPAWDPSAMAPFLQTRADGVVLVRMKPLDKVMEYDRHRIPSAFGKPLAMLDLSAPKRTLEILAQGLEEIQLEKKERQESADPSITTRVNPDWYADVTEEMVWIKTACNWLESSVDGKRPNIYRQYGNVVDLVVGSENEDHFIESFREAGNWDSLFKMVNEVKGKCSWPLWHRVNKRITELVNRVLTFNMALTGLTIESFAEDGFELIDYLKTQYSDLVQAAFLRNQATLIRSIFETMSEGAAESLDSVFIDNDKLYAQGTKPVFTHLVSNASFTFLNCFSHELSIEFDPSEPALVSKLVLPVLFNLLHGVFEESNTFVNTTVARHYIQMLDGVILEADVGFFGDEAYLVRLLK